MIGAWYLDEGEGSKAWDRSGNEHHGAIFHAAWQEVDNRKALYFDGFNSRIVVESSEKLQITGDITVCARIYKTRNNRGKRWDAILTKNPGVWDFELLTSMAKTDQPAFFSPACTPQEVYAGEQIAIGRWQHLAMARHGDVATFYLDGRATSSRKMSGMFPRSDGALMIGHDGDKGGRGFGLRGSLREVLLFSRALTEDEIRNIAND